MVLKRTGCSSSEIGGSSSKKHEIERFSVEEEATAFEEDGALLFKNDMMPTYFLFQREAILPG